MSNALTQFRANRQPADGFINYWHAIILSPLGSIWGVYKTFMSGLVMLLLIVWDFLISAFSAVLTLLTTLPLSIFFLIFAFSFFALYLWWAPIINVFTGSIVPVLQDIFNAIRLVYNVLILIVLDIFIQIYDALAPWFIFLLEFFINFGITLIEQIVELLDELDLVSIFEDLMTLIVPLLQFAFAMIKLLVAIGPGLITALAAVIVGCLKIMIVLVWVFIAIFIFLFLVLVIALAPILIPLLILVALFAWIVGSGSGNSSQYDPNANGANNGGMSRMLLSAATTAASMVFQQRSKPNSNQSSSSAFRESMPRYEPTHGPSSSTSPPRRTSRPTGPTKAPGEGGDAQFTKAELNFANEMWMTGMGNMAISMLSVNRWQEIGNTVDNIAGQLLERTSYLTTDSGAVVTVDDIFPDYDRVLYDDLEDVVTQQEATMGPDPRGRQLLEQLDFELQDRYQAMSEQEKRALEEEADADDTEYIDTSSNNHTTAAASPRKLKDASSKPITREFDASEFQAWHKRQKLLRQQQQLKHKVNFRQHRANISKRIDPNGPDHFLIDHSIDMDPVQIFPGKAKHKYRRINLAAELLEDKRGIHVHHRRRRWTAIHHSVNVAVRHVYRRHIRSGHMHRVVKDGFKALTNHDNLPSLIKTYRSKYANAEHMLFDMMPDWDAHPWTKAWKESDPAFADGSFHDQARKMGFKDGKFPKWVWDKYELSLQREDDRIDRGGGASFYSLERDPNGPMGPGFIVRDPTRPPPQPRGMKRQLMDSTDETQVDLSFFYRGKSCSGTGASRFIFCIPRLPFRYLRMPQVNLADLLQIDQLTNATSSQYYQYLDGNTTVTRQLWHNNTCLFCLDMLWNTWMEIRFMIYWLDIISYVLLFGAFFPYARPSIALGLLGKIFPPAGYFIDKFLIYPVGTLPPVKDFIFFFQYFFPLAFLIFALYVYKTVLAWFLSWLYRSWIGFRNWVTAIGNRSAYRRTLLEAADENQLALIISSYYRGKAQSQYKAGQRGEKDIEIGDDIQAGYGRAPPQQEAIIAGDPASGGAHQYDADRVTHARMLELELANEALKAKLAQHLDRLENVLGAGGFNIHEDSVDEERRSHHKWHDLVGTFHIPFINMPSYQLHLQSYQESLRIIKPPPLAHEFEHLVVDGQTVPVHIHTSSKDQQSSHQR